jgi:hypothetical protein
LEKKGKEEGGVEEYAFKGSRCDVEVRCFVLVAVNVAVEEGDGGQVMTVVVVDPLRK